MFTPIQHSSERVFSWYHSLFITIFHKNQHWFNLAFLWRTFSCSQSYSNTRREKQMATGSHRCRSQCRGGTALCACLNRETNISSEPLFLLMCWVSWPLDKSNGDFIIALIQLMTHALKVVPQESKSGHLQSRWLLRAWLLRSKMLSTKQPTFDVLLFSHDYVYTLDPFKSQLHLVHLARAHFVHATHIPSSFFKHAHSIITWGACGRPRSFS